MLSQCADGQNEKKIGKIFGVKIRLARFWIWGYRFEIQAGHHPYFSVVAIGKVWREERAASCAISQQLGAQRECTAHSAQKLGLKVYPDSH